MSKSCRNSRQERARPTSSQVNVKDVDAALKDGAEGFSTPDMGIVAVDLEDVREKFSHFVVDS